MRGDGVNILKDLYYGNICPCDRDVKRGSKVDHLQKLICCNEDELVSNLTDKQKEVFEKYKEVQSELYNHFEREVFAQGFILVDNSQ